MSELVDIRECVLDIVRNAEGQFHGMARLTEDHGSTIKEIIKQSVEITAETILKEHKELLDKETYDAYIIYEELKSLFR